MSYYQQPPYGPPPAQPAYHNPGPAPGGHPPAQAYGQPAGPPGPYGPNAYAYHGPAGAAAMPVMGGAAPSPGAVALPHIHMPDQALIDAAYRKAAEEAAKAEARRSAGGTRLWPGPLGPNGQTKWDATVPVPYTGRSVVWICPAWAPGKMPWVEADSHFLQAQGPGGKPRTVACVGRERCPICFARNLCFKSGNAALADHAKNTAKPRHQAFYNILLMEYPNSHWDAGTGKWLPWVLRASSGLHGAIMEIFKDKGLAAVDPMNGRTFTITKKKTGQRDMDVEWGVIPGDPAQLPQAYWPPLYNLHNLESFAAVPSRKEVADALIEARFPYAPEVEQLLNQIPEAAPAQPAAPPVQQGWQGHPGQQGGQPAGYNQGYPGYPQGRV